MTYAHSFYKDKFSEKNRIKTQTILNAEDRVETKYNQLKDVMMTYVYTEERVVSHIKRLKNECAAGCDGIQSEHLKYCINSAIPSHLSNVFTLCAKFGLVPKTVTMGILVPILKKTNIDPTVAKNYRPIIVSTVFSKIIEMNILEESNTGCFNNMQFGFVEGRGTNMAIRLASDVTEYCNKRGSSVYACALDAEMAFDGIPHSILLHKAVGVIPDVWWRILHKWYSELHIKVKWNGKL